MLLELLATIPKSSNMKKLCNHYSSYVHNADIGTYHKYARILQREFAYVKALSHFTNTYIFQENEYCLNIFDYFTHNTKIYI